MRWHSPSGQRVADPEVPFHPQIAQLSAGVHEGHDLGVLAHGVTSCVAGFVAPQHPHFIGTKRVEEEWRMGGYENLRRRRRSPTLFGQPVKETGMQEILRFLNADERRRNRIVQQGHIGEHLERTVRCEAGHHRLGKTARP